MSRYQSSCCALIKQINDSLEKHSNNLLRKDDLTMMQISVLMELDASEENRLSMKDLEHNFGVAQPTMLGIVRRLEQKGLVETYYNPEDKRAKLVHLTDSGRNKCLGGYSYMDQTELLLLNTLDEGEREQLHLLLEKVKFSLPS